MNEKFLLFVKRNNLITKNDSILLSFSGGVDSVALFHLLHSNKRILNIENLALFHLNHNLRGNESIRDENFVIDFAKKYNVPLFLESVDVKNYSKENRLSTEEAGRRLRYFFLKKISSEKKFDKIATAHHLNDQTETFFLNLIRGRGFTSFRGIRLKLDKIIRPLLCFQKREIINYCEKKNLDFLIDSSNYNNYFLRNRIRNKLLPFIEKNFGKSIEKHIIRLKEQVDNITLFIEDFSDNFFNSKVSSEENKLFIKLSSFPEFHFLRFEIYKKIYSYFCEYDYRHRNLEMLDKFILSDNKTGRFVFKGINFHKEYDKVVIFKEKEETDFIKLRKEVSFNLEIINKNNISFDFTNKKIAYFDAEKIKKPVYIRYFSAGDKFFPLGLGKETKLKKFFINLKIPARIRKQVPILVDSNNNILWIIPYRIDDRFKVTEKTINVLKCEILM